MNQNRHRLVRNLARMARISLIAAVYVVLCIVLQPFSYGWREKSNPART